MRLFFAIDIPNELKVKLSKLITDLKTVSPDIKWVKPDSLHLTLKFLGEVEENKVHTLLEFIDGLNFNFGKIEIELKSIGFFPHKGNPRVVWVDISEPGGLLKEIASRLDKELMKLDFKPEEREFKPHLTIGRFRSRRNLKELLELSEKYYDQNYGKLLADKIILFQSILKPSGAEYKSLKSIPS